MLDYCRHEILDPLNNKKKQKNKRTRDPLNSSRTNRYIVLSSFEISPFLLAIRSRNRLASIIGTQSFLNVAID